VYDKAGPFSIAALATSGKRLVAVKKSRSTLFALQKGLRGMFSRRLESDHGLRGLAPGEVNGGDAFHCDL
jgi:hypothetical protein